MPTRHCGLLGYGVKHSLSPYIHELFAQELKLDLDYQYLQVTAQGLPEILKRQDLYGLNVTTPYKMAVIPYCIELTDRAKHAGAVNTLIRINNGWQGDNTDGIGWVKDVAVNLQIPISDKIILIIGAGGAVRGLLRPLLSLEPKQIVIANRTPEKAQILAKYFKRWGKIKVIPLCKLAKKHFDFVIQASYQAPGKDILSLPQDFNVCNSICYDLNYGAAAQNFLHWAKSNGAARVFSGVGMLVEQAAESFWRWHRIKPNTANVIDKVYKKISAELRVNV